MCLCHPLDLQNNQRHRQWVMRQHRVADCCGRADDITSCAETAIKFIAKSLKQMNMFGLFSGKLQKCSSSIIIRIEFRPRVIHDEWENKFLDETKDAEIGVSSNLVELETFVAGKESQSRGSC